MFLCVRVVRERENFSKVTVFTVSNEKSKITKAIRLVVGSSSCNTQKSIVIFF